MTGNDKGTPQRDNFRYEPISIESQADEDEALTTSSHHPHKKADWQLYTAFWTLGVLNNSSYVIMLASAKSISEGATALVFLANILPALLIKGTAPYWFDHVCYTRRLQLASCSMITCFGLVASSTTLIWQLLGVTFASLQGGLGEASLLALAGKMDAWNNEQRLISEEEEYDDATTISVQPSENQKEEEEKGRCLTCFSSGTGFAGVFGFFWKWFWNDRLGFTLSTTLWLATGLAVGYWSTFRFVMKQRQECEQIQLRQQFRPEASLQGEEPYSTFYDDNRISEEATSADRRIEESDSDPLSSVDESVIDSTTDLSFVKIGDMTGMQRFGLVMSLWPYTVPLFTVYVAEYTLQSGTWTTIGFPVSDVKSRVAFYEYSNWMYQAGVFLSRSSGTLFTAPMALLWLMPLLQVSNVGFYWFIAASQQDHEKDDHSGVYSPAFLYTAAVYTGLLGGAVYCHGYLRICKDLPLQYREFALSATSVAECLGIVVADVFGLVIQACLYQINGLDGAILTCPMKR